MSAIKLLPVYLILAVIFGMNTYAQTNKKGFAVLELFTSEGCSSCPPADALMGKIQEEYKNDEVYILAYHVDYWDHQGWKDIFGNPDYTRRQYKYSDWLNEAPVYTPQLVINGKTALIGSQAPEVRQALKKALSIPALSGLQLKTGTAQNGITVNYSATGIFKKSNLVLAVVQKSAQSKVKRGENGGRTLYHYQIVRQLNTVNIPNGGKGSVMLQLPDNFTAKDFEVIGFVQDNATGLITGASKAAL